jgi:hypothetical protein
MLFVQRRRCGGTVRYTDRHPQIKFHANKPPAETTYGNHLTPHLDSHGTLTGQESSFSDTRRPTTASLFPSDTTVSELGISTAIASPTCSQSEPGAGE